jgi:cell shape-determining protein MreD
MTKTRSVVRAVIGTIFVVAGVIWSIMFPKTADVFRPDFVASVAIGMGLILPGIVILFFKRLRVLPTILSILLFWSLLLNVVLISWAKTVGKAVQEMAQENSSITTK